MFFVIITILLFSYLCFNLLSLKKTESQFLQQRSTLIDKKESLESINTAVSKRFKELEESIQEAFLAYELTRDISPLFDKAKLLEIFMEKLKSFGKIKNIKFSSYPEDNYLNYELKTDHPRYLCVGTSSKKIKEYLPLFLYQLNLCLERNSLYNKLQEMSIYDSLTGVYNRRHIMERLNEEFERAKKFAFNLSFLMVDIDFFKSVNDTYGHIVGDVVLRKVASLIKESVREIDSVGRFGGEEFSVILPETSKKDAIVVAKRIVKRISSTKIKAFDESIKTTVSIGLASYPENSLYLDMIIEIADRALYKSKESGRNIASWF